MRYLLFFCCLFPLCCGNLGAIALNLCRPSENLLCAPKIFGLSTSVFFEQEEVQGLLNHSRRMENCIAASGDPVGDTLSALICAWSSVSPLYKEILNDLARLGIDACPDYSFIINCYPMAGFYERFNLIPFWGQHRPVGIQQNLRFLPENIQTDECVIKCYGTGVTIVDDYDGSSDSPTLRCRSLPWGIKKPLDFRRPIIAIVLENSELSEVRGYLWCFAVMCIYRADETLKVALNLYFASSNAAVNIDLAVGAFLDGNRVIPFAAGVGRFSDILVARMQAHMQAYASDDDDD